MLYQTTIGGSGNFNFSDYNKISNLVDIIPSFFNERDFWAMLLPGYVLVILGLFLFFPGLIFSNNGGISFDLLSTVVFIVGGPAAGFTLLQFYYYISAYGITPIRPLFKRPILKYGWRKKFDFRRKYEQLKLKCTDIERLELEELEGRHFFGVSTGIALTIIGLYALIGVFILPVLLGGQSFCASSLIQKQSLFCDQEHEMRNIIIVLLAIFALATILHIGAYYEYHRIHLHLICKLIGKYSLKWPEICEDTKKAGYKEMIDETFRRFRDNEKECLQSFDRIKSQITLDHEKDRLSQSSYQKLKDRISEKTIKLGPVEKPYEDSFSEDAI